MATKEKSSVPIGSYTSYLRTYVEPCLINAEKADKENIRLLGINEPLLRDKIQEILDEY